MQKRSTSILAVFGVLAAMALGTAGTALAQHGADDNAPQVQLNDGAGHH